ncbi:MAG TPA: hypothetical protein VIW94_01400 [Acidimicrobiia bacterium]
MRRITKPSIGLIAAFSLVVFSGIALAEPETNDDDTLFSFGYDEENHVLAVNTSPTDSLYVCEFENGALTAQYGEADGDGVIPVESLEDADGPKDFEPRLQHELAEGLIQASEPFAYAGADGECRVNGIVVAGPNGQINHGQFMKAFKELIDIKGHGCLNRYLAQSDLGKTESTKIATSDVDPEFELSDSGELSFKTFEADCLHGKKADTGESEIESDGTEKGKPEKTGKPEKSDKPEKPGKSGAAPGQNK